MVFVTLSSAGSIMGKEHPTSSVEQPLNSPRKLTSSFPTPNSARQNGWTLLRRRKVWPKLNVAPTSFQLVLPAVEPEMPSAASCASPSLRAHEPFPAAVALKAWTPRNQRLLRSKSTLKLQLNPLR